MAPTYGRPAHHALVATGAAVFILSSMSTDPASAGRAAQVVSGIGFLGAGVIMREGLNIRGLNTAATLWCSAGIGVLCGWASIGMRWSPRWLSCAPISCCAKPRSINLQPHQQATDLELCYRIQVTCGEQDEILVRTLILQALNGVALRLQSLRSADISSPGQLEVCGNYRYAGCAKEIEGIVCRVSPESVSAVRWRVASELPV